MISQEYVLSRLDYDEIDGSLTWKPHPGMSTQWHGRYANKAAGCVNVHGYVVVRLDGKLYLAHRLIWFMITGEWAEEVDHINRVKADNRWINLRDASCAENMRNRPVRSTNKIGLKGVHFDKEKRKWAAQIVAGRHYFLGYYATAEEAHAAYCKAATELHADFRCW